jgi:signal peptidase I
LKQHKNWESGRPLEYLLTFVLFAVLVFNIRTFMLEPSMVPSKSMLPTLEIGDIVFAKKWGLGLKRFQIITFKSPAQAGVPNALYVKRIIGLSGEKIHLKGQQVYINDVLLTEDHSINTTPELLELDKTWQIPQDSLFLLGDNRGQSDDSSVWGPINKNRVVAEVVVRFWPTEKFGLLK